MDGLLPIDKPAGMTSFDVIYRVREATGEQKVGHMGTLDKAATGLLLVMIGRSTKLKQYFGQKVSDYRFTMEFGEQTDTLDVNGEVVRRCDWEGVDAEAIGGVLPEFTGEIEQRPPQYSAVKIEGKRASDWARREEEEKLPEPREVEVRGLELVDWEPPVARLECELVSGGYVRSLVRDIAERLGTCATTTSIRRTRTNHLSVDQALPVDELNEERAAEYLLDPVEMVRELPSIEITEKEADSIGYGKRPPLGEEREAAVGEAEWFTCLNAEGELVAVAKPRELDGVTCIQPRRVMKPHH